MMTEVDKLYFATTGETHRLRDPLCDEIRRVRIRPVRFRHLRTIVRASDGACITVCLSKPDDLGDYADFELAGAFDADLDLVVGGRRT